MNTEINNLIQESELLFNVLDKYSSMLIDLELKLNKQKIFFPFSLVIHKEDPSLPHKITEKNSSKYYTTRKDWSFSWERKNENHTSFRIYLICQEIQSSYSQSEPEPQEHYLEVLYKKPIIESKIEYRIKYLKYLNAFIESFQKYIKEYRTFVEENGRLPSAKDIL